MALVEFVYGERRRELFSRAARRRRRASLRPTEPVLLHSDLPGSPLAAGAPGRALPEARGSEASVVGRRASKGQDAEAARRDLFQQLSLALQSIRTSGGVEAGGRRRLHATSPAGRFDASIDKLRGRWLIFDWGTSGPAPQFCLRWHGSPGGMTPHGKPLGQPTVGFPLHLSQHGTPQRRRVQLIPAI